MRYWLTVEAAQLAHTSVAKQTKQTTMLDLDEMNINEMGEAVNALRLQLKKQLERLPPPCAAGDE